MARSTPAVQALTSVGLAPTYAAADNTNGEQIANNGRRIVHVKNASGGGLTVTVRMPTTVDGLTVPDRTVSIPAGTDKLVGPFGSAYTQAADGNVYVDYSTGTSITRAVLEMPLVS